MRVRQEDLCHDATVLPYSAYLRVYQPLDAFSPQDRRRWEEYALSPDRPRRIHALSAEQRESLGRLLASPPRVAPEEESEHAYLRVVQGRLYVCPWQTRLRSWRAYDDFSNTVPFAVSESFVPAPEADRVEEAYRSWLDSGAVMRTGILSSNWTIPVPWFVPFEDDERCLVLSNQDTRTLLYLTRYSPALRRLEHTSAVLREHVGKNTASGGLERVKDWLASTAHPEALVELDYGGLPYLLSDDHLHADRSVAEVSGAVAALAEGESGQVREMRERLLGRWRSVRALQHAN